MPDNAREIFVKNLNEMMQRRGVSQSDIAKKLNVTSATDQYQTRSNSATILMSTSSIL